MTPDPTPGSDTPPASGAASPGTKQLRILQALWDGGPATARSLVERLRATGEQTSLSTVQTQLRLLMKKQAVTHTRDGRQFVFEAVATPEAVASRRTQDLLDTLFGGSVTRLMSHLLEGGQVSAAEAEALADLIDRHAAADGTDDAAASDSA